MKINKVEVNTEYTLPVEDGAKNQTLYTDGSGNVSWSDGNSTSKLAIVDGSVYNVLVVDGGSGYVNPTVTIAAPASGIQATAEATVVGGVITAITLINKGSGYVVDVNTNNFNPYPEVTIEDDSGGGVDGFAICYVPEAFPLTNSTDTNNYYGLSVLTQDGAMKVWGSSNYGQLGLGSSRGLALKPHHNMFAAGDETEYPVPIQVIPSHISTFVLCSDGSLWASGYNGTYELGLNDVTLRSIFTKIPQSRFGNMPVVKVKTQGISNPTGTWAFTADGKLYRWGYNGNGQLGDTTTTVIPYPTELTWPKNIVDVTISGAANDWNTHLLEDENTSGEVVFEQVLKMTSNSLPSPQVTSASSENGAAQAAWKAFDGLLRGDYGWISAINDVVGSWLKIDLGVGEERIVTSYGLIATYSGVNRTPKDWIFQGSNNDADWDDLDTVAEETGWVANEQRVFDCPNTTAYRYYRILVSAKQSGDEYVSIQELRLFGSPNGHVWSVGANTYGVMSIGTALLQYNFAAMQTSATTYLSEVTKILGGGYSGYPVFYGLKDGYIYCSGYNAQGQLSDGTVTATGAGYVNQALSNVATPLTDITKFAVLRCNHVSHIFAQNTAGSLYVWGYNSYGQLGVGNTINHTFATLNTQIDVIRGAAEIEDFILGGAGSYHSSAVLLSDGRIYTCGYNGSYNLAIDNTTSQSNWQYAPLSNREIKKIMWTTASSEQSLLVLADNGKVYTHGAIASGKLGDGQNSYVRNSLSEVTF